MSKTTQRNDNGEDIALNIIAGPSDEQNNTCNQVNVAIERTPASCCNDKYYRRLAHWSIICGCSCIGIQALENSLKAERTDGNASANLSKKARNLSIISIVTFFGILLSLPLLTLLISYLVTLKD